MSSERSISPDPLPRSRSGGGVTDRDSNGHSARHASSSHGQKRRRDVSNRTPSPASRSSVEETKSPVVVRRHNSDQRSPSPARQASSSSKRRRPRTSVDEEPGRRVCAICSNDVESNKRLYGILDNCDHVFCYECIVSWKRSKYSNAESESCPVCKVRSAFITPSKQWYESKDEKTRLVKKHKGHLKTLPCRYYLRHGFCRYSDRCFYDHQEAAKQYRQENQHSRDRDRDRDHHHGSSRHGSQNAGRSHYRSPSPPPPPPSNRYSSSGHRDRPY